jgi:nucleoside-diphosphate-sugar epimerase
LHNGPSKHKIIAAGRQRALKGPIEIEHFELDLSSLAIELPERIDTVLHIAGEKVDESRMHLVNHQGTKRLVEAAARSGVRRFVYISSVGVYGAPRHSGLVTESFPHTPRNRYEASKDAGEACVREVCARAGMDYIILQPSNVIGIVPGRSHPLLGLMKSIKRGRFTWFGTGNIWANYVAVEDVAAAVIKAAENGPPEQTFIINTPERLSELVRWISDELRVPMPHRRFPLWVGQAVVGLGSVVSRFTSRSMPINRERLLEITNTTRYDGSLLMTATGFTYPLGIETAIRQLVRQYIEKGLL